MNQLGYRKSETAGRKRTGDSEKDQNVISDHTFPNSSGDGEISSLKGDLFHAVEQVISGLRHGRLNGLDRLLKKRLLFR